jgi:hypothetical protein
MVELAPYLIAVNDGQPPASISNPPGYPLGSAALPGWKVDVRIQDWETITVPAGRFRALRVEATGQRVTPVGGRGGAFAGRFKIVAWYAPEVKRLARLEHQVWSADVYSPSIIGDDLLELLSFGSAS